MFDDLILLEAGRVMYHGPAEGIVAYFDALGYAWCAFCPRQIARQMDVVHDPEPDFV